MIKIRNNNKEDLNEIKLGLLSSRDKIKKIKDKISELEEKKSDLIDHDLDKLKRKKINKNIIIPSVGLYLLFPFLLPIVIEFLSVGLHLLIPFTSVINHLINYIGIIAIAGSFVTTYKIMKFINNGLEKEIYNNLKVENSIRIDLINKEIKKLSNDMIFEKFNIKIKIEEMKESNSKETEEFIIKNMELIENSNDIYTKSKKLKK